MGARQGFEFEPEGACVKGAVLTRFTWNNQTVYERQVEGHPEFFLEDGTEIPFEKWVEFVPRMTKKAATY